MIWRILTRASVVLLIGFAAFAGQGALAQDGARRPNAPRNAGVGEATAATNEARRLPREVSTKHQLKLANRMLEIQTSVSPIPLIDEGGKPVAEMVFTTYRLESEETSKRPLTFILNGGPGSASTWLQFGALGPWRLDIDAKELSPSARPDLLANNDTWLDFTDLVFIDPIGTGYSRSLLSTEETKRQFWTTSRDIDTITKAIGRYIRINGRSLSPKFLVGESYAGYRGPRLARALSEKEGAALAGLILVSPAIDFSVRELPSQSPLRAAGLLPSAVAALKERNGDKVTPDVLLAAETYAAGEYLVDLVKGPSDQAAIGRLVTRLSALTGLDKLTLKRSGGRLDTWFLARETLRDEQRVASAYDLTVVSSDPYPEASFSRYADPFTGALAAPFMAAASELYRNRLNWSVDDPYLLSNNEIFQAWTWERGALGAAITDLRHVIAADPRLLVFVAHGTSDVVTPYFETKLQLRQIPVAGGEDRLRFETYSGGHMFYARAASRLAFRASAEALMRKATAAR